jgi:hypothetical protein
MSISEDIYPKNRFPGKWQIEQMIRVAVHCGFKLTAQDIENFGWVEKGMYVGKEKSLDQIRKHVSKFWDRMTPFQKSSFIMSYLVPGLRYISGIVESFGDLGMKTEDAQKAIDTLSDNIFDEFKKVYQSEQDIK